MEAARPQPAAGSSRQTSGRLRRRLLAAALVLLAALALGYLLLARLVLPGLVFLARYRAAQAGVAPRAESVQVQPVRIPAVVQDAPAGRALRARLYLPPGRPPRRAVLFVHGLHAAGIDEPRLITLARLLAQSGYAVLTPEFPDLVAFELGARTVEEIERAARWLLAQPELSAQPPLAGAAAAGPPAGRAPAPAGTVLHPPPGDAAASSRIGAMGVSFGGGLMLSAVSRPGLRDRLHFAFALGGHADLDAVIEYLCTGGTEPGEPLPPHVYAVAVLLRLLAERCVPAPQVQALRGWLLAYLREGESEAVRASARRLPEAARRLAELCLQRRTSELGALLASRRGELRSPQALSPLRHPPPHCPVYLLHGSQDNVIPPAESVRLAQRYREQGAEVHLLLSPLVVHAELQEQSWLEAIRLAAFWTSLLRR
ncbi:MAG: hypothetical protein KatS3mg102_1204 [Planctomycetota bacterium]|nr:MAG: hypothetical protein KatS3mg102_1204 [Planctomycetota bacterium]